MSYNGSGTYSLYATGNPVVTATTVSSTWANNTLNDIATGLTLALCKDGQSTPTANLPMGTFKLTGLGDGSAATDSMAYGQRAKFKIGTTTRDLTTATGTQDVTGIGFTPTGVILFAGVTGTSYMSLGMDDATTRGIIADQNVISTDTYLISASQSIYLIQGAGVYQLATVSAFASGQFTLSWTKSGSPTGTATIIYLAFGY